MRDERGTAWLEEEDDGRRRRTEEGQNIRERQCGGGMEKREMEVCTLGMDGK